eukprot:305210-Prorocentrum_minimum.AAC.1
MPPPLTRLVRAAIIYPLPSPDWSAQASSPSWTRASPKGSSLARPAVLIRARAAGFPSSTDRLITAPAGGGPRNQAPPRPPLQRGPR